MSDRSPINDVDLDLLACVVGDEADGEPVIGHLAVIQAVFNRIVAVAKFPHLEKIWGGPDIRGIVSHPWQFSCYNRFIDNGGVGAYMRSSSAKPRNWGYYSAVIQRCAENGVALPGFGCDTYCRHDCWPIWRQDGIGHCRIGDHVFIQLYDRKNGSYISQAKTLEVKSRCSYSELSWLRPFLS